MSLEEISNSENVEKGYFNQIRDYFRELDAFHATEYGLVGDYDTGSGSGTDDVGAVQDAVNAAEDNGGGLIVFPASDILLRDQVTTNTKGIHLIGQGRRATHFYTDFSASQPVFHVNGTNSNRTRAHTFSGFSLKANESGTKASHGIKIDYSVLAQALVREVEVWGATESQITLDNSWGGNVVNSYVGGNNVGTYGFKFINANGMSIRGSQVNGTSDADDGYGIYADAMDSFSVRDCLVENCGHGVLLQSGNNHGNQVAELYTENLAATDSKSVLVGNDASLPVEGVQIRGGHFLGPSDDFAVYVDQAKDVKIEHCGGGSTPGKIEATVNASNVAVRQNDPGFTLNGTIRNLDEPATYVPAQDFYTGGGLSGTATQTVVGTGNTVYEAYQFSDGSTEEVSTEVAVPEEWGDAKVGVWVYWASGDTNGNDITVSAEPVAVGSGEDLRVGSVASDQKTDSTTGHGLNIDGFSNWQKTISQGDLLNIVIRRNGGAGSDTLSAAANIVGIEVRRIQT